MQYDFLVLFPINPKQLADYRKALYPSGAKSDPTDAELLARFLREHIPTSCGPGDPTTPSRASCDCSPSNAASGLRTAWRGPIELQQRLKESYPLALELGGSNLCSETFLALLEQFPDAARTAAGVAQATGKVAARAASRG